MNNTATEEPQLSKPGILPPLRGHLSLTDMRRALVRNELYSLAREVKGSIVECGVRDGRGLRDWANLTQIFDPYDFSRRVIGFDTFSGFPSIHSKDRSAHSSDSRMQVGGMAGEGDVYEELQDWVKGFDLRRPLNHIPKVELVRGDACETMPKYVEENPHLIISLLFLDFDVYEPTVAALEALLPRMPGGAILVFDELNQPDWPGETTAVLERFNLRDLRLRQFPWEPNLAYAVI